MLLSANPVLDVLFEITDLAANFIVLRAEAAEAPLVKRMDANAEYGTGFVVIEIGFHLSRPEKATAPRGHCFF